MERYSHIRMEAKRKAVDDLSGADFELGVAQNWAQFLVSEKSTGRNVLKTRGEPGRTRTCNPLLNPEMLCSWFFKHFLASYITVFHGVWQGFVPKLVPRLPKLSKCRTVMCVTQGQVSDLSPHDDWMAKYLCLGPKPFACWM